MFCTQCGTPITPGKAFCRQCGVSVNAATTQPPAAYPPPYQRAHAAPPPRKRGNKLVFILVPALLAVVAAVLFLFVIDLRGPEQRVRDAIDNTSEAVEAEQLATEKALGVTKIMELMHNNKAQLEYAVNIALPEDAAQSGMSIPGPDGKPLPLDSASVSGTMYTDLANGGLDWDLGLGIGGTALIDIRLSARDELMAISSEELFGGSCGFYPKTFGQDYEGSVFGSMAGGEGSSPIDAETFFDIVGTLLELTEPASAGASRFCSAETESALKKLEDVLWSAAVVEEFDGEEVLVNGIEQSCEVYQAVYERPAFIDYLYAYVDTILADEELDFGLIGALSSMSGTPISAGDDLENSALESFEEAVSENIEVTFFIKNDRLLRMDALLFGGVDGTDEITLSVEYGDGEAISNALAFSASQNGEEQMRIELSGSQVIKDGVYSRYISFSAPGEPQPMEIELWYDTGADFDNFTFAMRQGDITAIELGGSLQINTASNTLDADFTQIAMSNADTRPESIQLGIQPDGGHSFESLSPTMLFEMDEAATESLTQEIMKNATEKFGGMSGGY